MTSAAGRWLERKLNTAGADGATLASYIVGIVSESIDDGTAPNDAEMPTFIASLLQEQAQVAPGNAAAIAAELARRITGIDATESDESDEAGEADKAEESEVEETTKGEV